MAGARIGATLARHITGKQLSRALVVLLLAAVPLVPGCGRLNPWVPLPPQGSTTPPSPKLHTETQTFTGKVVLVTEGYRLRLSDSGKIVRVTRAKRETEFAAKEINLRKYYEKNLAVSGSRGGDWLWGAEIVGQFVQPGEATGPNLLAPPVNRR